MTKGIVILRLVGLVWLMNHHWFIAPQVAPPPPLISNPVPGKPAIGFAVGYNAHVITAAMAAQAFSLELPPKSLVFRNGILAEPGFDYAVQNGTLTLLTPASPGDRITVVTFP